MRPLRWADRFGIPPALVVLALASVAFFAQARETPRTAPDVPAARIESPRLFGANVPDAAHGPASLADVWSGMHRQARAALAADASNKVGGLPLAVQPGGFGVRGACDTSTSDVCFDLADNHIIYRPARKYMIRIDGFTAESVTLRRDGIRFRYSFR